MKLLMLGYRRHRNIFETVGKILELEKFRFDIICFEDCTLKELIVKLKDAEVFFIYPTVHECEGNNLQENRNLCLLETLASGFLMAHKGRFLVFAPDHSSLGDLFYGEPVVPSIGGAVAHFRRVKKVFQNNKILHDARRIISQAKLSFSSKGMAEAVEYGMYKEAQAFLNAGFSTETETAEGVPVLNLAVRNGDLEMCRLLMSYGASLNIIARDRCSSPVMDAVTMVKPEVAELLIDGGADLDFRNRNGQSSLIVAIGARMDKIAELLIDKGADITIKDSLGMSAVEYARLFSLTDIKEKLESKL